MLILPFLVTVYLSLEETLFCTKQKGAPRCSKALLHDFTRNMIHHFKCDKPHRFLFVLLLKVIIMFYFSERKVY